jgi:hypothetical protein
VTSFWHSLCSRKRQGDEEMNNWKQRLHEKQEGAIGYIFLWLLGVPASVLFVIFLLRGCN